MTCRDPNGPAVIVDPYSSGALYAPAFAEFGVPVVAVLSAPAPPDVYASSYRPGDFAEIVIYDGDEWAVVERLRALRPRCVMPGCESGVELADLLASLTMPEVANEPGLAPARRDKAEMARAVAAARLPVIRQICTSDAAEVAAWIDDNGLAGRDLVIKPTKSASTDGVSKAAGGQGWQSAFDALLGRRNRLGLVNNRLLVQEFARGVEYVVDTFSHDGTHTVADVCRYRKVDNGPHMAVYDALEWVPPSEPDVAVVVDYAQAVLDAIGIRFGAAHVEIMLTADGPRLIEVGARPHGGGHPRFCRLATGDSQLDRAVRFLAGRGAIPEHYGLHQYVLVVFLLSRADGVVSNASCLDDIRGLDSHHSSIIQIHDGDRVQVTKDLFGTLDLGFVVLAHPDREQLFADYDAVRKIEQELVIGESAVLGR